MSSSYRNGNRLPSEIGKLVFAVISGATAGFLIHKGKEAKTRDLAMKKALRENNDIGEDEE